MKVTNLKHSSIIAQKKYIRVTHQILIGNDAPLFQNTTNINDGYVYNIDVNVNEFSESLTNIECEDFMSWFQI